MPVARDVNNHTKNKKTCAPASCWSPPKTYPKPIPNPSKRPSLGHKHFVPKSMSISVQDPSKTLQNLSKTLPKLSQKSIPNPSKRPSVCPQEIVDKYPKPFQNAPKPLQNPPRTLSKPLKIEPKSSPGASKSPFGEHSKYKHQKKTPKSGPGGAKRLQTPPKILPKPSPNPPKIDRKTQSKKTYFLETFFSRFFSILTSKSIAFLLDFWGVSAYNLKNAILQKLSSRLDGSTIFKVRERYEHVKNQRKID